MTNHQILVAGFGGQGIQFAGKVLVYIGMQTGHEVTLLPSYGPEMRGGTSYCSVVISDEPIGAPIVIHPSLLVVMNLPSFDKFEPKAAPGAKVFVDSTLVNRKAVRDDVETFYVPATGIASDNGMTKLANMVMVGKLVRETGLCDADTIVKTMEKVIHARHRDMLESNVKAIKLGMELA